MDLGLFVVATENSMPIDQLAIAAEERGFESLWIPEHTHIPLDSAYPGGVPIPEDYAHTLDPFIALAIAASVTSTIRLGRYLSGHRAGHNINRQGSQYPGPGLRRAI